MHSNGFHSSSRISERRGEDKDKVVYTKGESGTGEVGSERLKDEKSAEQVFF